MKTLSNYKSEYKKAKTSKGKTSAFNRAMLNLNQDDQQLFVKWQVDHMNSPENNK
jgi:hypothetical protein